MQVEPIPKPTRFKSRESIESYKAAYPFCAVCGKPCGTSDPHHLKSKGSGGSDAPENLLRLCPLLHHVQAHNGQISRRELRRLKERECVNAAT